MVAKLELVNVTKSYGKIEVIKDLSIRVESGEFFVVLGPSGTGKSTLLRLIVGIEQPDRGKVIIDGNDVTKLPPNKRNIAMVFQNYALYPNLNVYQNIAFPLKMHGRKNIPARVKSVAEKLHIEDILGKRVQQISGGQQQRVALARAIVRSPSMFLLDEPLSNLDARVRFSARSELKKIQRELRETFLFVTHDQKEAEAMGDRVGVLHGGKFEQVALYKELYDNPDSQWIGDFVGDFPMNFIDKKGFRPEWTSIGYGSYSLTVDSLESIGGSYFVHGTLEGGNGVILRSGRRYEVGEVLRFSITQSKTFS